MRVWNNLIFKEEKKSFPLFSFMIFLSCHQESLVFTNILRGLGVVRQQLFQFMATSLRLPTFCFPRKLSSYFIAKILTVRSRGASTVFKITENISFKNSNFWHFSPIFVLSKLSCLETMSDFKIQVSKNVEWDFFCDFQTPWLSRKRRGDKNSSSFQ